MEQQQALFMTVLQMFAQKKVLFLNYYFFTVYCIDTCGNGISQNISLLLFYDFLLYFKVFISISMVKNMEFFRETVTGCE